MYFTSKVYEMFKLELMQAVVANPSNDFVVFRKDKESVALMHTMLDKIGWYYMYIDEIGSYIMPVLLHVDEHIDKTKLNIVTYAHEKQMVYNALRQIDTEKMRTNCATFANELAEYVFHPLRVQRMASAYQLDMDEYLELV